MREGSAGLVATVSQGRIRGFWEDGVATFLGVPYAAPPINERAFLAPEPPAARQHRNLRRRSRRRDDRRPIGWRHGVRHASRCPEGAWAVQ
jgi:hypothetical protein